MSAKCLHGCVAGQEVKGDDKAKKPLLLRPRPARNGDGVSDLVRDGEENLDHPSGSNKRPEGGDNIRSRGDKGVENNNDRGNSDTETSEGWILVNVGEGDGEVSNPKEPAEDEPSPLHVHAKQYHRILKRRAARQRLEEYLRVTCKDRKPYVRHGQHAQRKPRGPNGQFLRHPDGRFLTAEEAKQREQSRTIQDGVDSVTAGMSEAVLEEKI